MTDTVSRTSGTSGAPGASDPSDAPGAVRPPADPGAGGFTEALAEATAVASLAPSSHNCQPWALARLTGERARAAARLFAGTGNRTGPAGDGTETLALAMDRTRTIGALAAHDVEMRVSCGAYWQLLLSALAAQGWHPEGIEYPATDGEGRRLAGDRWPKSWSLLGVARVRRTGDGDGSFRRLRETAAARRTNRGPYRASGIGTDVLAELTGPSAGAAADAPVAVTHLRGETERRAFGDFVARHGGRDFSHDAAWRETFAYLRPNASAAALRGDGFTLEQLFGPMSAARHHLLRTALAPRTMRVLRFAGYPGLLASQLAAIVRRTPAVTVMHFLADEPSGADMVRAGARLADYWLRATHAGLALHPVSVVVQHDDVRAALAERFGLRGRVFFVARLGHPTAQFPATPRHREAAAHLRL